MPGDCGGELAVCGVNELDKLHARVVRERLEGCGLTVSGSRTEQDDAGSRSTCSSARIRHDRVAAPSSLRSRSGNEIHVGPRRAETKTIGGLADPVLLQDLDDLMGEWHDAAGLDKAIGSHSRADCRVRHGQ
jgi:hypothetical protein